MESENVLDKAQDRLTALREVFTDYERLGSTERLVEIEDAAEHVDFDRRRVVLKTGPDSVTIEKRDGRYLLEATKDGKTESRDISGRYDMLLAFWFRTTRI